MKGFIIKQLIYASTPSDKVTLETVQEILTIAKKMNFDNSITGMLIYNGRYFLQCIEGPKDTISTLFTNIKKDSRHFDIKLLGIVDIDHRDFEEWNMGYMNSSKVIEDVIKNESDVGEFKPHNFNFEQAKNILYKLSFLI